MIKFDDVHKTYPKQINRSPAQHALKGVSFAFEKGQTLGLIGQNGAGKSTSIRLIMGYMRPDQGKVLVMGEEKSSPSLRQHIGYLPETSSFPSNLTCMELLQFAGRCCDMDARAIAERAEDLLLRLGIWEARQRRLSEYSKGMQQRASFAAALIHDPELLILDEPMSGLDPIGRAEIIALIHDLRSQGKSILFCSHLLDDVERITDQVAILHQGNLLYDGSIADLCEVSSGSTVRMRDGKELAAGSEAELSSLLQKYAGQIIEVRQGREDLQGAFVRLVKGSKP
jgi:ABC-2 type transport system ATP-binding protein